MWQGPLQNGEARMGTPRHPRPPTAQNAPMISNPLGSREQTLGQSPGKRPQRGRPTAGEHPNSTPVSPPKPQQSTNHHHTQRCPGPQAPQSSHPDPPPRRNRTPSTARSQMASEKFRISIGLVQYVNFQVSFEGKLRWGISEFYRKSIPEFGTKITQ